jgi:hypothetical protein
MERGVRLLDDAGIREFNLVEPYEPIISHFHEFSSLITIIDDQSRRRYRDLISKLKLY